jgi:anti-sigma B factor antagonist
MSFRIAKNGDTVTIGIEGQLVASNRQQLKQSIADELERGSRAFVIDFAETGYIDSAGLGVLVSLSKKIREAQGELRLANLNEDLKTLFELTRLDTLFHLGEGSPGATGPARQRPEPDRSGTTPRQSDEARP